MESNPASNAVPHWPFIRTMVALDMVDSTSDRAADLVRGGSPPLPLCVWARRQTRGRGRGTHRWWADSGSLTFTLALDPAEHGVTAESEPKLALTTAVAVIEALVSLGLDTPALGIRWPNDIEANGRKLGGILPERIETDRGRRVLIGVGINVLSDPAAMPPEVRNMATTLREARPSGTPPDDGLLARLLSSILAQIETAIARMTSDDPDLVRLWNERDLLRGEWVRVALGGRLIAGWGCGIRPDGGLCLDTGHGLHEMIAGQVLR